MRLHQPDLIQTEFTAHHACRAFLTRSVYSLLCLCTLVMASCGKVENGAGENKAAIQPESDGAYHVRPGESIQAALDAAAKNDSVSVVKVHEGIYAPSKLGQAFIWLNQKHDGIKLQAVGDVTLTSENEEVAVITSSSFPAIVNHVIYIGDGITSKTEVTGFKITGANALFTEVGVEEVEPNLRKELAPGQFFFSDGGAVKVFGNSSPILSELEIFDNEVYLCGGGISVEQRSQGEQSVTIRNCIFRNNKSPATGSAIDLLEGSKSRIENCLFVGNIGNYGMDHIAEEIGLVYKPKHGSGALTVFPKSTAIVTNCTFTDNWNGVDDDGFDSRYENCIFWKNSKSDNSRSGAPYELDVNGTTSVKNCTIFGGIADLNETIKGGGNSFEEIDPDFDSKFTPQSTKHSSVGYRTLDTEKKNE